MGVPRAQRVHEHHGREHFMAGGARRLLTVALFLGSGIVLIGAYSLSEFTLTLILGTLFATAFGTSLVMKAGSHTGGHRAAHLHTDPTGIPSALPDEDEQLPDPLAMNFDIPL